MTKLVYIESQRMKPVGVQGINTLRAILKQSTAQKVNEVFVDVFTASAIVSVFDRVNPENQAKMLAMPVAKASAVSFRLLNKVAA